MPGFSAALEILSDRCSMGTFTGPFCFARGQRIARAGRRHSSVYLWISSSIRGCRSFNSWATRWTGRAHLMATVNFYWSNDAFIDVPGGI